MKYPTNRLTTQQARAARTAARAAAKAARDAAREEGRRQRRDPAFWRENPDADGRLNTMTALLRQSGYIKCERVIAQALLVPYAEWLLTVDHVCHCGECGERKINRWQLMKEFLNSILE